MSSAAEKSASLPLPFHSRYSVFAVARSPFPFTKTVISTEAAHAFVSSGAEKSASLSLPLDSPYSCSSLTPLALTKISHTHPKRRGARIDHQSQTGTPFRQRGTRKNARAAVARVFEGRALQGTRIGSAHSHERHSANDDSRIARRRRSTDRIHRGRTALPR